MPNVCVYLYTSSGSYAGNGACTDGTGTYTIIGVSPGQYTIGVYDPAGTHPTTWYGGVATEGAAQTFAVAGGSETSPVDVAVPELTGISGQVTDPVTHGTVPGACVYATQTAGGNASYGTCLASASSTYALTGMNPGTYDVAFVDPSGLHSTAHTTATVAAGRITVAVNGQMNEIASVVGTIIDAASSQPVTNACVMLYAPGGGYVPGSYRCTDNQGRFVIDGVAPGTYLVAYYDPTARFNTSWWDGKPDQQSAIPVTVAANTITSLGAARVTTFGSATGLVVNADGTPAANVCVYADDLTGRYSGVGGCSDAAGRYTLAGLSTGQYKIAFYPPGSGSGSPYWYLQRASELSATPITINGLSTTNLQTEKLVVADDTTPPGVATDLTATSANSAVHLSWTNPTDADYAGATIRRSTGTTPPGSPADGTAVAEVGKPGTSFDDTNVTPGETYSYAVFAHDGTPNYAAGAVTTVTAVATSTTAHECGTLGANATWSPASAPVYVLDCTVVVGPNSTLTLAAGTIIKTAAGAGIVVEGSLVGSGTTADNVVVTSLRDDSIAGDTNGDGSSTGPARGDWSGISTQSVSGSAAPSIIANHMAIRYAGTGLSVAQSAVQFRNGILDHLSADGIDVSQPVGIPAVSGNSVTNAAGSAILIQSASVDMGALDGNSGAGDGLNAVALSGDTVTVSSSLPWSGNLVPVLYGGCSALTVPAGVTLTLGAGTILKGQATGCSYLNVQGTLVGQGTAASPVTLTSWRDDSVGGDTNGDGNATGPARGDWGGISASPAGNGNSNPTVNLDHTIIKYATVGVSTSQTTTSITNGVVDHSNGDGVDVSSPVGTPTITGNTVTNAANAAVLVESASIDMGALNGNSGSPNGLNGVQLTSDTLTASSSLPWTGNLVPVLYSGCNALTVPVGVTLTLGAGAVIKAEASCSLQVQGTLLGQGTAASPVTLTSWRDDSVGGDTNADGNATGPQRGDWGGILATPAGNGNPNPTVDLNHTFIKYATVGVSTSQTTTSITNSMVDHSIGDGVDVSSPVGTPTITGNAVTNTAGNAILVDRASIDMGALNGNSGSSDGLNGLELSSDTVGVSSSLPWSGNLLPVLYGGCSALTVPTGVTLTLGAGTLIKGETNNCAYLNVQGSLIGQGTGTDPVVLTSWRDDSVGGDTNGDGNATGPATGDWGGIVASPAGNGNANPTISLDHAIVKYATVGVSASQSTTSLTDSTIDRMSGDGLDVSSPVGTPTITGNSVTNAAGNAILVQSASIDMGALDGNSGSSDGLNGVALSSDTVAVSSSLPWTGNLVPVLDGGCSALTVPSNVTLTLGAGTIIKGETSNCAYLSVQGSLVGEGTGANPVVLTSWRDDSVGGDTNGDGNATGPATGDWGGIVASPAGNGNANPTISLDHTIVKYATVGVSSSQSTTSLTNSTIDRMSSDGVDVSSPVGTPTLTANTVTNAAGNAILVQSASIDMGALDGNSGSSDGLNGVALSGDTVSVSSSLPWSGNLVPVLDGGCNALTVPSNVTLTLGAGTIIKGEAANCAYLSVQGSLVGHGTAASPVVLTSWRDDSVGGDTNADGNATYPQANDWGGVYASPAGNGTANPTIDLDHAVIKYAGVGLSASQSTTLLTNSTVDRMSSDGVDVSSPVGTPTITGNTVTNVAGNAILVQSASIDMGALNGNAGSSDGLNGVALSGDTVTVSSSLPWSGNLIPVLYGGCSSLTVPPGVTLTLGAGAIIKGTSCTELVVQGTLDGAGTSGNPAILTSSKDDSVGGDTNGDGSASSPATGDWTGVISSPPGNGNPDPTIQLTNTEILYATTGLAEQQAATVKGSQAKFADDTTAVSVQAGTALFNDSVITNDATGIEVSSGQTATFQGQLLATSVGASAPAGATLDVRNSDWGNANGPAPWGDGTLVQGGGVLVYPWVGMPTPQQATPPPPPPPPQCADVDFIGVDGSGETPANSGNGDQTDSQGPADSTDLNNAREPHWKEMNNLYRALHDDLAGTDRTLRLSEIDYPADGVEELAEGWDGWEKYFESYLDGLYGWYDASGSWRQGVIPTVEQELKDCPNEKIVLAGYSQGAWVVHDAEIQLAQDDPDAIAINRVLGIVLVADPERVSDNVTDYGSAPSSATGILEKIGGLTGLTPGPTPVDLEGVTRSLCNDVDIICAPGNVEAFWAGKLTLLDELASELPKAAMEAMVVANDVSTVAGCVASGYTADECGRFYYGDRVHGSKEPTDGTAYACQEYFQPGHYVSGCSSLLTDQAQMLAQREMLFAKPSGCTGDPCTYALTEPNGQAFTDTLQASVSGFQATWRLKADGSAPPSGVNLASDGTLAGDGSTPSGTYRFNVEVEGAFNEWTTAAVVLTIGT